MQLNACYKWGLVWKLGNLSITGVNKVAVKLSTSIFPGSVFPSGPSPACRFNTFKEASHHTGVRGADI
jgi:hypothetical protein